MDRTKAESLLQPILALTREYESDEYYSSILNELDEQGLERFIQSNELWGGSGSIADQLGMSEGREIRRKIEDALIALGDFQISEGIFNRRTKMWVDTFKDWANTEI